MRLGFEYIAAFLDCDGTIVVVRAARDGNQGYRYYGKICFYSQNLQVLNDIQETIGGSIPPPALDVFMLQLAPMDTVAALKQLVPYLRLKREQALLVLKLHEMIDATYHPRNRHGRGGAARLPESVYQERHALHLRVKALNHKDSEEFHRNVQALRTNRVKSVKPFGKKATPSQAAVGQGAAEGVTTREVTPKNNPLQETPARKGRHSLSSAEPTTLLQ